MISWDDSLTISQTLAQDNSATAVSFLNMMMNVGYKEVLTALGRQVVEQQATSTLVVTQRNYQVPPDCNRPKTLVLISGTNRYEITEEPSDRAWELRRQNSANGRPIKYHFRPRFGVGGGILELDPIPSTANTLEMTYEATERDLSKTKYTTGTIALTLGSATVVGTGTTFTKDMEGRYLRPTTDGANRLPYRVLTYNSATSLTLEQVYHGTTQSSLAFEVFEMFALPEDCQMMPIFYANYLWWASKGNVVRAEQFESKYTKGLSVAKKLHSKTTADAIISYDSGNINSLFGEQTPSWFPTSVS